MGDNETHDFIISDDEDNVSLRGDGESIAEEGEGDFVISDDVEDYLELARAERELWLRGLVMNMINALDAKDVNRDLRRQRKQLMDACDSCVAEEFHCGGDNDLWETEWKPNLDYCYVIKDIFKDEYRWKHKQKVTGKRRNYQRLTGMLMRITKMMINVKQMQAIQMMIAIQMMKTWLNEERD